MKIVVSEYPPHFIDLDAPTLGAEPVADGGSEHWRVWCKHCGVWHYHGPAEGHREAHCDDLASPYVRTGYDLAMKGG